MFLYGSIFLRLKVGQLHDVCPRCKTADSLRMATPEEVAAASPAPSGWSKVLKAILWAFVAIGGALVLFVLVTTKGQA